MAEIFEASSNVNDFFEQHLFPTLHVPWQKNREGSLNVVSRICHGAPCPYTYIDHTMKSLEVTIEGIENQEFRLALEEIRTYSSPLKLSRMDHQSTDGSNVRHCIRELLIFTWQSTGHGRLSIKSKKHRNGKIEVFVGETTSYRFFVDPDNLIG